MEVNGYDFYDPKADYDYKEMAMIMMVKAIGIMNYLVIYFGMISLLVMRNVQMDISTTIINAISWNRLTEQRSATGLSRGWR